MKKLRSKNSTFRIIIKESKLASPPPPNAPIITNGITSPYSILINIGKTFLFNTTRVCVYMCIYNEDIIILILAGMDIWEQLSSHHIQVCVPYKILQIYFKWTYSS